MSIRARHVRRGGMEAILERPTDTARATPAKIWTSRVLSTLIILFLAVDGVGKVLRLAPYVEGTAKVGYPDGALVPLGLTLLVCALLYAIPRTAVLGAVLLTAYFGGATATHVRMSQPFIFPIVFGILTWGCLYLRDERVRALLPLRSTPRA